MSIIREKKYDEQTKPDLCSEDCMSINYDTRGGVGLIDPQLP